MTRHRYGTALIWLHWLTLLLLIGVYACINLHELYPHSNPLHDTLKAWHFMLGLTVLGVVVIRLLVRLRDGKAPPIVPPIPAWQRYAAGTMHVLLYVFMLAMPLLGWAVLSAVGREVPFFGLSLPPLIGQDRELGLKLKELHETIGTLGYYLIGLHAAAALFHHYWTRDNTLLRMWPGRD